MITKKRRVKRRKTKKKLVLAEFLYKKPTLQEKWYRRGWDDMQQTVLSAQTVMRRFECKDHCHCACKP